MGELLAGAVLGTVANELVVLIKFMVKKTGACKHLQKTLEGIIPILDEVDKIGVDRFPEHSRKQLKEFHQKLQEGKKMVQSVSRVGCWNVLKLLKWSVKIRDLENYIKNFTQKQGWIHVLSEVCHLRKDFCQRMEINEQDRSHHSAMLQMIKEQICPEGGGVEDHDSILQIPESPKFQVGLNVSVEELKEQLFAEDVSVLGVKGIGGSGKTTLAVALCKHPQVKAHFQEKIIFETVSQSPNLKGLLENLWKKISRQRLPNFHNVEDARTQIQKFLRDKMPQPILVVLDDVWAQMDLETLLFEAKGYKTVVTTRRNFALFDSVYDLQLLREEYALSPFCFSAFKQESIPETEDENLVKQVVAECKGLPLALKVIGRSLHQQPRAVWLNAKNQLSQAEVISDYQKDGLLKRMSTSIYVLEDKVQQCFLDLGLFPEDKKIPVDALMDIWVYVHDLDLHAAYTILMELASRNLLNLVNNGMNHPGISYGMNCEAYVVQHDVLRDLAIYLAKQESITKCKRLIMPQK